MKIGAPYKELFAFLFLLLLWIVEKIKNPDKSWGDIIDNK